MRYEDAKIKPHHSYFRSRCDGGREHRSQRRLSLLQRLAGLPDDHREEVDQQRQQGFAHRLFRVETDRVRLIVSRHLHRQTSPEHFHR